MLPRMLITSLKSAIGSQLTFSFLRAFITSQVLLPTMATNSLNVWVSNNPRSASNSSAKIMGSEVITFGPNSGLEHISLTTLSGVIRM